MDKVKLIPDERPSGAGEFVKLAQTILLAASHNVKRIEVAEQLRATDRVQRILKATVGGATTGDPEFAGSLADYRGVVEGFMASLRTRSLFYAMVGNGALTRVPMRARVSSVSAAATGWIVGQGKPVPLNTMTLARQTLPEFKAAALIVVSEELIRSVTPAAFAFLQEELRAAVADAVDLEFLAQIVDSGTETIASLGNDNDAFRADMKALFDAVALPGSRLMLAGNSDVAIAATFMDDDRNEMTPEDGRLFGVPFMVTNSVPPGTLFLLDGAGILGEAETITIDVSRQADIEMLDNPTNDSSTGTAAQLVSMFQTNGAALMTKAYFGCERRRENAVGVLTDIAWGDMGSGS